MIFDKRIAWREEAVGMERLGQDFHVCREKWNYSIPQWNEDTTLYRHESRFTQAFQQFTLSFNRTVVSAPNNSFKPTPLRGAA